MKKMLIALAATAVLGMGAAMAENKQCSNGHEYSGSKVCPYCKACANQYPATGNTETWKNICEPNK